MIGTHKLNKRDQYLNKLIGFQDTEPVKVVTGPASLREIQPTETNDTAFARNGHPKRTDRRDELRIL